MNPYLANHEGPRSNRRLSRNSKVRQLLDRQDLLTREINAPETDNLTRCALSREWRGCEEMIFALRGKLMPGKLNGHTEPGKIGRPSKSKLIAMPPPASLEQVAAVIAAEPKPEQTGKQSG